MKLCPQCQTRYSDDTLRFCLQDGTPLVGDEPPTVMMSEEPTVVRPPAPERINFEIPASANYQTAAPNDNYATNPNAPPVVVKKSNTATVVLLTVLATLIAAAVGGVGAWVYFKNKRETARIDNQNAADIQTGTANKTDNANKSDAAPTPTAAPANAVQNAAATPTPLSKKEADKISDDVADTIDGWKSASENGDIGEHLGYYAPTINYYNRKNASAAFVRSDKQKAFAAYDSIDINIGNVRVTPNQTGDEAVAVFDKKWEFSGAEKESSGKVQSELRLKKIGGKWKITGERDVKVYYVNK